MVLDIDRSERPRGFAVYLLVAIFTDKVQIIRSRDRRLATSSLAIPRSPNQDWTLSQIFGKYMKGTCPLTDPTVPPVRLQTPNSRSVYVSDGVLEKKNLDRVSCWPGARCPDHPAKPQPRY
ncbi:hypothetical protein QBC38DRAFT_493831 [Podospora fimiseda]|uniref:Uncharacterized protein n=1 Tax=Podospora fimiseda TaxID=252190 RepID=A0AAN7BER7_9PEZI|nr:hypothetical protein QBC38DRAFT_493831 [Podospora fimiseda]